MKKIIVTGATGFLGGSLITALDNRGFFPVAAVRKIPEGTLEKKIKFCAVGNIDADTEWFPALVDADCVIHTAAKAHFVDEITAKHLPSYRIVNVDGTRRLAEQAAVAGVRRFIFLSSIGVNGVFTDRSRQGITTSFENREAFTHHDYPDPREPYGISKWEAEQALWDISEKTGLEVVVVRPPLVYGPGVRGNLGRLLTLVGSGIPLPFGAVRNQRSMIGVDNLVELLIRCVDHSAAGGQTFLVSDGEDLSTPSLIRCIAAAMGRSPRLFPVPVSLLRVVGCALSKRAEIDRLVRSLQIDSSYTRQLLGWTPSMTAEEGIRQMVKGSRGLWFQDEQSK